MKKLISILMSFVLLMTSLPVSAMAGMLRFPSSLSGIEESAFEEDASLEEADLPWGTETIGTRSEEHTSELQSRI